MAGALEAKDIRDVLESLKQQGATLHKVKSGYRVLFPDGKATTTIHWTNSDHRSTMNLRADIKRAGFQWPFDNEESERAHHRVQIRKGSREKLNAALTNLPSRFTMTEAIKVSGLSMPTISAGLHSLGYSPRGGGANTLWTNIQPSEVTITEDTKYPEIEKAKAVPITVVEPAPAAVEPPLCAAREFIDSVDSWTIVVPPKLQSQAAKMGLNIEVRLWRNN